MITKEILKDTPTTNTINTEFEGKIPTLEEIITKFPPKIEKFEGIKGGPVFFRKISRARDGTPLYFIPPSDMDLARENLIFPLEKTIASD